MHLHFAPRLVYQIGEQVVAFRVQRTSSEFVYVSHGHEEDRAGHHDDDLDGNSELGGPHVGNHVERNEKVQLHVNVEGPSPIEAPAILLFKVWNYITYEEQLRPPVLITS